MTRLTALPAPRSAVKAGGATTAPKRLPGRLTLSQRVLEGDFEATVEAALAIRGWQFVHLVPARVGNRTLTAMSKRSTPGFPDLLALRRGWQIAAELKVDGRYPTPAQRTWLTLFAAQPRTLVWVLRPGDAWGDVARWLDRPEDAPAIYGWSQKP